LNGFYCYSIKDIGGEKGINSPFTISTDGKCLDDIDDFVTVLMYLRW